MPPSRPSRSRSRGLLRLALLAAAIAVAAAGAIHLLGGGSGSPGDEVRHRATAPPHAVHPAPPRPRRIVVRTAQGRLPQPLSGQAAAPGAGSVLAIGGADAADSSVTTVSQVSRHGVVVRSSGALSAPLHDAAAATLGSTTLVFGGGALATVDTVEALAPGRRARIIGQLPSPRSDVSAVTIAGRAFVLGGFDGSTTVAPVL